MTPDLKTLIEMAGIAVAVAVPVGGLTLWGVRLGVVTWIRGIEERLKTSEADFKTIAGDLRRVEARSAETEKRVTALEVAREEQWRLLSELKRLITALHDRFDEHAEKDSEERRSLSRELGALNQAVRGHAQSGGLPIT
jgi:uncharacterized coiled-coil protein SlyX